MPEGQDSRKAFTRFSLLRAGLFLFLAGCLLGGLPACAEGEHEECSFFDTSLHKTGEGMRYWYEEEGGFMEITGIPYKELGCKHCHVKSCDQCHAEEAGDQTMRFSVDKSRKSDTCLVCHVRATAAMGFDKQAGFTDVHFGAGMACADCHKGKDVHGDGKFRHSMRAVDSVNVGCEDCHPREDLSDEDYHTVHDGKLHCNACHVTGSMTCNNCHFDEFLRTGVKKGKSIPSKSWVLLVNYQGQVTSGNAQTLTGKGKTFVAYAPYYTHSVTKQGRTCDACHGSEHVKTIVDGKSVKITDFVDGTLVPAEGIIPLVPGQIEWAWLDMGENKPWTKMQNPPKPQVQIVGYGKPLTEEQIDILAEPME